jgi:MoaE-MoaD fusion protein
MKAKVLFFGVLREITGRASEDAEFASGASLADVFESYATRFPKLKPLAGNIVAARNQEFAPFTDTVNEGDELAFLPPVSGGAEAEPEFQPEPELRESGNYYALTMRTIDVRTVSRKILTGAEGAVVTFEGTTRNSTKGRRTRFLEYECYQPMALKQMAAIGQDIAARPGIERVAIVHRLGRILIGETSVAIIVTAPHRKAAFEAALDAVDRLKKTVPIWKKEYFEDGEVWAEGDWDADVPVAQRA